MITYLQGDATSPIGSGNKLIIHITNNIGAWGSGFVVAISKRWKEPEQAYRSVKPIIGTVQFVENVGYPDNIITVANMCAQEGTGWKNGIPPIRYESLRSCLQEVAVYALEHKFEIHAPRFGAGLAGGDWNVIESLINDELCKKGIEVFIYDFPISKELSNEIERRKNWDAIR